MGYGHLQCYFEFVFSSDLNIEALNAINELRKEVQSLRQEVMQQNNKKPVSTTTCKGDFFQFVECEMNSEEAAYIFNYCIINNFLVTIFGCLSI